MGGGMGVLRHLHGLPFSLVNIEKIEKITGFLTIARCRDVPAQHVSGIYPPIRGRDPHNGASPGIKNNKDIESQIQ